jgi:hypothetical protein
VIASEWPECRARLEQRLARRRAHPADRRLPDV